MDNIAAFGRKPSSDWEALMLDRVWGAISERAVQGLYVNSAFGGGASEFRTRVDVALREWAVRDLPIECARIGRDVLLGEFLATLKVCRCAVR